MPLTIEDRGERRPRDGALVVALINNMPDAALEATETQFGSLLQAAAGAVPVRLRRVYLPEVARAGAARERIERCYDPFEALLADPPDALIVTGMEPRAATLEEEPYWDRMVSLLAWAEDHTVSSLWSCLAAHAAAQALAGVRRQRLAEKCFGVFKHEALAAHPLLHGLPSPIATPHSRWNELPPQELRAAGFTVLTASREAGVDLFVRRGKSLLIGLQGHPEYEAVTLLKEYRRDVGRFLRGEQADWPALPRHYFGERGLAVLARYRREVEAAREPDGLETFPTEALAAELQAPWRPGAVGLYRNWLAGIAAANHR